MSDTVASAITVLSPLPFAFLGLMFLAFYAKERTEANPNEDQITHNYSLSQAFLLIAIFIAIYSKGY